MNEGNLKKLLEATSVEFDPTKFLDAIFKTLQEKRSQMAIAPNQLFKNTTDVTASASAGESNLNVFLRLLGFPATRDESSFINELEDQSDLLQSVKKDKLSQNETLNYVSPNELLALIKDDGDAPEKKVLEREQSLSKGKTIEDHFKMLHEPLPLDCSLKGVPSRRPSLFPLVVSADVPVFPLSKRAAPAFHDGEYIRDRRVLTRPFIENVIYMRTKNFSGAASELKDALKENIRTEISKLPVDESNESGDSQESQSPQETLTNNIENYNVLQLQLTDKFIKTLKACAEKYNLVRKKSEELSNRILFIPKNKNNFFERAGQADVSDEEKERLLSEVLQEAEPNIYARELDAEEQELKQQKTITESFVQLLPTETLKQADEIRKLGDIFSNRNIVPDVFISEFNALSSFELDTIKNRLKKIETKRSRAIDQYESVRVGIMVFTGEMIGLSIFDIICVLFALFTVDIASLIALLNQSSQDRLLTNDLFYSTGTDPNSNSLFVLDANKVAEAREISVGAAVKAVQEQVEKHFELANSFIRQAAEGKSK